MIKLIATDMDGTWLREDKTYDEAMFVRIFDLMQEQNIKFVVASGNQHANLLTRFPNHCDKIYFVAENGAMITQGKQILRVVDIPDDIYNLMLNIVDEMSYPSIVSGVTGAYILKRSGQEFYLENYKYYKNLKQVDDYEEVDDRIFKVSIVVPSELMPTIITDLRYRYPEIGFVAGSANTIDMSTPGMNKAVGLKYLSYKLGIKSSEMVAFGDSGNDVGMLEYVGHSFAMGTALPEAKKAAKHIIGSCDESAVQYKILDLLTR